MSAPGQAPAWLRAALVAAVAAGLPIAMLGGLARLGWADLALTPAAASHHGVLLVHGAFGTLIGLERCVASGRRSSVAGPIAGALGLATYAAGLRGAPFFLVASALLASDTIRLTSSAPLLSRTALRLGAGALFYASLLLLMGASAAPLVPAWIAFLVLTIAGERLTFAEAQRLGAVGHGSLVAALAIVAAAAGAAPWTSHASRAFGVGLALLTTGLVRFDVARRTIRTRGLPRFAATALLAGYGWLGVGAVTWTVVSLTPGTGAFDIALHSVLVGFVLSMVMAHGPTVLAALTGRAFPYRPILYVPLGVLHASLAMRVAGDVTNSLVLRRSAGVLHLVALALYTLALVGARATPRSDAPKRSLPLVSVPGARRHG